MALQKENTTPFKFNVMIAGIRCHCSIQWCLMPSLIFSLDISSQEYLRYYKGVGKTVWAVADDGRTLEFPASWLTRFVSHTGVQGRFEIVFDDNNKLLSLHQL